MRRGSPPPVRRGYPAGLSDIVARLDGPERRRATVASIEGEVPGSSRSTSAPVRARRLDCRIIAIVVDAGVRERGIGRLLIAEAERIAVADGAAFFEITAGHHRPEARQLYESLGYDAGVTAYLRKHL
jgi:GNAT superfamily N-acetyltransferase